MPPTLEPAVATETQSAPPARLANIDRLRLIALADIVSYHASGGHLLRGIGLPTFLLFTVALNARPRPGVSLSEFAPRKLRAYLTPWLAWSAIYGAAQSIGHVVHHQPPLEWFRPVMLLLGMSPHLWYLVFGAIASTGAFVLQRGLAHWSSFWVIVAGSLIGAGIMIPERLFGEPPARLADWLLALPSIPIGMALGRCIAMDDLRSRLNRTALCIALSMGGMAALELFDRAYSADRYILTLGPVGLAIVFRGVPDPVSTFLSRLAFGTYLIHPLLIRVVMNSITGDQAHLAIRTAVVMVLALGLTWVLSLTPLRRLVIFESRPQRPALTTSRTPAPAPHA